MTSKVNIKRTPTLLTKNLLAVGRVSPPNHHPSLHKKSFINQLGRVFLIYDFPQLEQKDKLLKVMPQLQLRRGDSGIRIKSVFTGRRLLVLSAPKVRKKGNMLHLGVRRRHAGIDTTTNRTTILHPPIRDKISLKPPSSLRIRDFRV